MKLLKHKKVKAILPKGYKVWRKISTYPSYSIIASKGNKVAIFEFDYDTEHPTRVFTYNTLPTPNKKKKLDI